MTADAHARDPDVPGSGPAAPVLVERDAALGVLQQAVEAARAGRGAFVVLEGLPGLGKSVLVAAAAALASGSGLRVLTARGSQLESVYGFGVVRQLLERALPADRPALDVIFEGEARFARRVLSLAADGPTADPFSVLQALHRVTVRLSDERATLLLVDDAHWADEPSLQFLAFLQNRVQHRPLAVVVATRPVPVDDRGALGQLVRVADRHVSLEPLSQPGAATLVRRVEPAATEDMCAAAYVATGGNPFYLVELAREAQRRGGADLRTWGRGDELLAAEELRRTVARRISALGDDAVALVAAAHILGPEARLRTVATLARLDVRRAERVLDDVIATGVLTRTSTLEFVHPLVHDAVGVMLVGARAADLRLEAARLLVDAGRDVERAAAQLVGTDPAHEPWVLDTLRAAARQAAGRGAPGPAVAYLRRALHERGARQAPGLLLELGTCEFLCGDPAAAGHLRQALDASDGDEPLAAAALSLARALSQTGEFTAALDVLRHSRSRMVDPAGEPAVRLDMEAVTLGRLDPATADEADAIVGRFAPRTGQQRAVDKLVNANLCIEPARGRGTAAEAVALAREALSGGLLLADQTADSHVVSYPVIALFVSDELDEARAALDDMAADAERRGSVVGRTNALCWGSHVALRGGDVAAAEAQARAGLELVRESGFVILAPYAVSFLCDALVEKGSLAEAAALWPTAGLDGDLPPVLPVNYVLYSRGVLRLALGQAAAAAADLLESGRRQSLWRVDNPAFWPWGSQAALALHRAGRSDQAREVVAAELAAVRAYGAPRAIGIALRTQGLIAANGEALTPLSEAVEVLRPSPARLEYARASVDLGAALRRSGHRSDAREHLSQGLDIAVRCGAAPLAERARRELSAAGARPRRPGAAGVAALTASERRVAQLAAAGRTNREIAQELFVTVKTVETHMHAVLRKLEVTSRTQLAAVPELQGGGA